MKRRMISLIIFMTFCMANAQQFKSVVQFKENLMYLTDVFFINADTGFTVGDPHWNQDTKSNKPTVLSTFDKGEHWNQIEAGTNVSFQTIFFVDQKNGWIGGEDGTLLKTTDGGNTWKLSSIDGQYDITGINFVNASTGWVVGVHRVNNDTSLNRRWDAGVWYTTNGGSTWAKQILPDEAEAVNGIHFITPTTGYIAGTMYTSENKSTGAVFTTSDAGNKWTLAFNSEKDIVFTSVNFVTGGFGWVGGYNERNSNGSTIYKTSNGGVDWISQNDTMKILRVKFLDNKRGYISGVKLRDDSPDGPYVARTKDGGNSWEQIELEATGGNAGGLYLSENMFAVVGERDYFAICNDPWNTLTATTSAAKVRQIGKRYSFNGLYFSDPLNGWVVGTDIWFARGNQIILHTTDGGNTWTTAFERDTVCEAYGQFFSRLRDIVSLNNLTCIAAGNRRSHLCDAKSSTILCSNDNGINWQAKTDMASEEFLALHAINSSKIWFLPEVAQTNSIQLFYTNDGGKNIKPKNTGIAGATKGQGDIFFFDEQHGWAAGGNGFIIGTLDSGKTWTPVNIYKSGNDSVGKIHSVCFSSLDHGWIAGQNLFETKDSGKTWVKRDIGFNGDIYSIKFTSPSVGWLAGAAGVIMHTIDGGKTWGIEKNPRQNYQIVNAISFVNDTTGWVCGDGGTILFVTTNLSRSIVGTKHKYGEGLNVMTFKRKIIVSIKANNNQKVSLELVDLSGKKILSVNKIIVPGQNQIEINKTDLQSGIYILRSREANANKYAVIKLGL